MKTKSHGFESRFSLQFSCDLTVRLILQKQAATPRFREDQTNE